LVSEFKTYEIVPPRIKSGNTYHFTTNSGILYEVRFGRKQDDILSVNIVFGVLNEEFDGEEYSMTNKGEVFRVMTTIVKIIRTFIAEHPNTHQYEFTGEFRENENPSNISLRSKIYLRYIKDIFDDTWTTKVKGNTVTINKKK